LQTSNGLKLNVAKALGGVCLPIFHNSDIGHTTVGKQVSNVGSSGFEGQVPNVGSEWGLSGKVEGLANGVSATGFISTALESTTGLTV
jgi:hypothetical protein